MSVRLNLSFPHDYQVELIDLPPASEAVRHIYFPGAVKEGGRDGLIVKFTPKEGQPWIGTFAFGYASPKALTGVFSCPDKQSACVVAAGAGYIIRVNNPNTWEAVRSYPIVDVLVITERLLLVFIDFTTLAAYGPEGVAWKTARLSWDGLKVTEVTQEHIKGLAWDSPQGREVEFFVDVQTGHHQGGSSPEMDVNN
jgi:hypothetical protein